MAIYCGERGVNAKWNVIAASVAGTSHGRSGVPCQDAHFYIQQDNLLIAAVADGAGSASSAEIGSSVAARTSVEKIADLISATPKFSDDIIGAIIQEGLIAARASLEREAQERSIALRDLATTLIVLVASEESVVAAQVGDGAIVVLSAAGELICVTVPPRGEYINETTFLVSDNWSSSVQCSTFRHRVKEIAAFSDGLQRLALKLPEAIAFEQFFRPLFGFVLESQDGVAANVQLETFLNSPRVNERTDDDKTLLLAGLR